MTDDMFGNVKSDNNSTTPIYEDPIINNPIIITIENYRSIKKLKLIISDTTQIIGRNNSGKTNIFLAINNAIEQNKTTIEDFIDEDASKPIKIVFEINSKLFTYTCKNPGDKIVPDINTVPLEVVYLKALPDFVELTSTATTKVLGKLINILKLKAHDDEDLNNLIKLFNERSRLIDSKYMNTIEEQIDKDLTDCSSNFSIKFEPTEITPEDIFKTQVLKVIENGISERSWKNIGSGTQRMILVLFFKYLQKLKLSASKTVLFLLEEPEIFMHPQQQKKVADLLYDSNDHLMRLIVSTHSPNFIRALYS